MTVRQLFPTPFYDADLGGKPSLIAEAAASVRQLAVDDQAGRRWCRDRGYRGYTSYASLNDLPVRDPVFADLKRLIDRHVRLFAEAAAFDLPRPLRLDSLWVNLLRPGGHHGAHIHPHSAVSGTLYLEVPPGSGALKIEDPRLGLMMAAPVRRCDAAPEVQPFVYLDPAPGRIFLWESWLRHEVMPHTGRGERVSVSFNYA